MDVLRTLVFRVFFYGMSIVMVLLVPVAALFGTRFLRAHANFWAWQLQWLVRTIVGARLRIEGTVPTGQILFAGKHESYIEALELTRMLGSPATVMKRELSKIPLWGWAAKRYGTIVVDREANAAALRSMMREAQKARATGRSVLIFPEGTRVPPGEAPPLRSGFAGLYRALDLPVVPVAVKSGHIWPRKGLMHKGEIVFRFGEPIQAGLPRREIEARVHAAINALNG
ncbi:lysophospholipid acyltransferase family protein [Sphingomonas sp. TDK1]|uniref:lysophospholipid acyltransferase family protein n=1 Tax=Sphingomonas sp. TDK1 TaxID=453247 RepID=UPI0007DA0C46|nr:lysophospholipid acyltransferase family protein [Sphingomonas sp. TDK1]OAN58098.1 glycerol acyltransferase [Sphingomonas sp. TDK1]